MIWNKDYETLTAMRNTSTDKVKEIINRALEYAKSNLTNGWDKLDDDFIVINVEGYTCVALVAEIGSAGLLNLLNIETPSTFTNSVAYIQSWIKALKNDTKMIVQASGKAEKAVRYIIIGNVEQEKIEGAA